MANLGENLHSMLRWLLSSAEDLPTLAVTLWLATAAVYDLRHRRIPNVLTFGGAVLGLLLQCRLQGWAGLGDGLAGFATGFFIFLPLYVLGGMGAGDVKLMAAAGTFLGWPYILLAVCLTTGTGAVLALLLIALRHGLRAYLSRYWIMLCCLVATGRFAYIPPQAGEAATQSFPYATAIAVGTLATLWSMGRFEPWLALFAG